MERGDGNMTGKGPGKHHRKGISLSELLKMFPDDKAATDWFEEQRWGEAGKPSHCPMCGDTGNQTAVPSGKPLPYWCGACRRNFSVRTGTVMQRSRIGLQKWALGIFLWATSLKGVSSMKLHRDLGITQKSAYFMAQRLREAWTQSGRVMHGPVEADETYIGGKRRNMSNARRRELAGTGRGAVGKAAVVGLKDRDSNRVAARHVLSTGACEVQGVVRDHAEPGTMIYTDEAAVYRGMPDFGHETVNHSVSEYLRGKVHTNGMESFWALLKRGHCGTFHKISPKHLQRYVNEFATRHNLREQDTVAMMKETVAMMEGKRLTYGELIADNGLSSGARS